LSGYRDVGNCIGETLGYASYEHVGKMANSKGETQRANRGRQTNTERETDK